MQDYRFIIPEEYHKKRLDVSLLELFSSDSFHPSYSFSRVVVRRFIEDGKVTIDGIVCTKPSFSVLQNQVIECSIEESLTEEKKEFALIAQNIPLEILFEDEDCLVVNKPAGMPTHPDDHYHEGTLVNAVLGYLSSSSLGGDVRRPGIVHRLDKDTSGCLIIAKNEKSHRYFSDIIAQRKIIKKYTALLVGTINVEKGTIDSPLTRDPHHRERMITMDTKNAKSAITHFDVLERYSNPSLTLVSVHIITGRTHQIRAHFRAIGHPVAEDVLYGTTELFGIGRMFLHASFLQFVTPSGKNISIDCPLPLELNNFLEKIKN